MIDYCWFPESLYHTSGVGLNVDCLCGESHGVGYFLRLLS